MGDTAGDGIPSQRGPVVLPRDSERVKDAEEEIFILYSEIQYGSPSQSSDSFRGLGYVNSHKDVLEIRFEIKNVVPPPALGSVAAPGNKKHRARKPTSKVQAQDKTVEIELWQDKTALRSRKGDTGSVLWKASIDFAQLILEQYYICSPSALLDREKLNTINVVELGSGTGLLTIALSPLVGHYTATDIGPLIPLIEKNVGLNFPQRSSGGNAKGSNVSVEELDWVTLSSASPPQRIKIYDTALRPVDLLLVVDCIYHPSLIPPFLATLDYLATPARTAVLVISELRAEDVMREFLVRWLGLGSAWEIWRIPNDMLGKHYAIYLVVEEIKRLGKGAINIQPEKAIISNFGFSASLSHRHHSASSSLSHVSTLMFFYISFLRPPPLQAAPYGTISVTPQISNDLRTEPFTSSQDLFYSWALESSSGSQQITTKPSKLTTYRSSSAYKEIPLPVPPGVREGQRWRLVLTGQAQAHGRLNPESVDLSEESVGKVPFPVISMPVLFMGKGSKGSSKQEMIERTYLMPFAGPEEGEGDRRIASLRFREKTSFDLDKKIWDSGIGLSSWLVQLKEDSTLVESSALLQDLKQTLFSEEPRKILELGAGIGIVSAALAVLRSSPSLSPTTAEQNGVLATDVPSAMPLLEQNISTNEKYYLSGAPKPIVLDWDDEEFPEEVKALNDGLDAIVMADVTYNTSSFPSLCKTLSRLIRLGPKPPLILLGYKERDEAERRFWHMSKEVGVEFEKVGERKGAGGAPVEVWVGRVRI